MHDILFENISKYFHIKNFKIFYILLFSLYFSCDRQPKKEILLKIINEIFIIKEL